MEEYPQEAASFLNSAEKSKKTGPSLISALEKRPSGSQEIIQRLFGGIKSAVGMIWRNKQTLAGFLAGATVLWFLYKRLRFFQLKHIYHALILSITIFFTWSKVSAFINRQRVNIPPISFPKLLKDVASAAIFEIERVFAFAVIHDDACEGYFKKFLMVVICLWFLSVAGDWADFLTLFYVVLHVSRKITKAVISSPGFSDWVNNLCVYILDRATASLPQLEAGMFIPGTRPLVLNVLKMLAKQGLILVLVGIGENYDDAKAFIDLYVTGSV